MVYKKVAGHFKKHYKTYAKGLSYGAQAFALASKVASLINVEKKYKDTEQTGNTLTTTPQIDLLTGITQGDGDTQRNGNSVALKSGFIRFNIRAHPSSTVPSNVRVMIIHDKNNNNGTAPTGAEILEATAGFNMFNFNKIQNKERFKTLMDKIYTVDNTAGVAGWYKTKYFKFGFIDRKANKPVEHKLTFKGTSSGDTEKGHLYILYYCDQASNVPSLLYNFRIRFVDN